MTKPKLSTLLTELKSNRKQGKLLNKKINSYMNMDYRLMNDIINNTVEYNEMSHLNIMVIKGELAIKYISCLKAGQAVVKKILKFYKLSNLN